MAFIQLIEITTSRLEDIDSIMQQWLAATEGKRSAHRSTLTKDRDRPDTYVQIVEFPSYDEAMKNSNLPQTAAFAEQLAKLCDGPPAFRNLDVRRVDQM
jgi:quinol monooxygenase YgiN